MKEYKAPATRIKEYYYDDYLKTVYRGQHKVNLFWNFSYWSNMFYICGSLAQAQGEVDKFLRLHKENFESQIKPTRYHKYP